MSIRTHRVHLAAMLLLLAGSAEAVAETKVVNPCTIEIGVNSYQLTIIGNDEKEVSKNYNPALSQTLSYAASSSLAYVSGAAIAGRDLIIGMMGLRWFPRGNARIISERDGVVETERSSFFKPFVGAKLEYGRVRSPYVYDQLRALELSATVQGLGLSVGARFDFTSRFGMGLEAGASHWTDTPSSSLTLTSTVIETRLETHFNF